jgi:hypothetical protein
MSSGATFARNNLTISMPVMSSYDLQIEDDPLNIFRA